MGTAAEMRSEYSRWQGKKSTWIEGYLFLTFKYVRNKTVSSSWCSSILDSKTGEFILEVTVCT
jgi:hypothetical protein